LPHHLQTTGAGWLVAAVVLVVLSVLVFAGGLQGLAVDITVVDVLFTRQERTAAPASTAPGARVRWRCR
jgi:hypothetical protein